MSHNLQMDGQLIALLVQNLDKLDENVKEEADGVHNTLGIFVCFSRCSSPLSAELLSVLCIIDCI